ncbi:MAG: hypothetical protein M0P94_02445 [Candidatus Absconditabacterales bacterium]|nr:hypothetical protein [Candidatus Absconditabacterales bacterium]
MLNLEQLKQMQKLSNITLDTNKQEDFLEKMKGIIQMIDELGSLDLSDLDDFLEISNPLRTIEETEDFPYKTDILNNVEHQLVNNSIKIKGAI